MLATCPAVLGAQQIGVKDPLVEGPAAEQSACMHVVSPDLEIDAYCPAVANR